MAVKVLEAGSYYFKMINKKLRKDMLMGFVILSLILIGMSFISATNECGNDNTFLGKFPIQNTITLKQICPSCSYVNLTSISFPNGTLKEYDISMNKNNGNFNSSFSETNQVGCYSYTVIGDKNGATTPIPETIDFIIGQMPFYVYIAWILVSLGIILVSIKAENEYILTLGGLSIGGLGIFLFNNGIEVYKNQMTDMISYFIIAIGIIIIGMAIEKMYNEWGG